MFIVPISRLAPPQTLGEQSPVISSAAEQLPFADVLKSAVEELQQAQEVSQEDARKLATGNLENLADIMINSLQVATAVELTTQITTRAVGAYKEIMQMQV